MWTSENWKKSDQENGEDLYSNQPREMNLTSKKQRLNLLQLRRKKGSLLRRYERATGAIQDS